MADRVVSYDFRGNFTNLRAGLAAGSASVKSFGNDLTALDRKGAKMRAGLDDLGRGAGLVALGAAAGLAAIVAVSANFDKAMSSVAATGEEARDSLDDLRQAALDAGAATAFSASEAAGGIENLLKAGVSAQDVLGGGLAGSLDLAAAGELDVASAAEIAATALTQFKLSGADIPHVADLLAAGAGKAQGDVSDLAMALKQSGLVASQMGISIEETTGTLAAFASAGLLGSDAGTSFRTMLLRLANPTQESADLMKSLGINAYDASGQFVGMASVAEQLKVAFEGKTQAERDSALATIFGSDAIRAAAVLYEQGSAGVQQWTTDVNDAGFAAETAATRLDNLSGDLEALKGSLETALIGLGDSSQGGLRTLVQGITEAVNAFNDLPGPMKAAVTAGLGFTALFAGGTFVTAKTLSGLATMQTSLMNLGVSAETATKSTKILGRTMGAAAGLSVFAVGLTQTDKTMRSLSTTAGGLAAGFSVGGPWGAALGGAIGLVVGLGTASDDTAGQVDEFTAALDKQTGALTENNRQLAIKSLTDSGALDAAQDLGLNLAQVTDAALGNAEAIAAVSDALAEYDQAVTTTTAGRGASVSGYSEEAAAVVKVEDAIAAANSVVDASSEKWQQNAAAQGDATSATGGLTSATQETADALDEATESTFKFSDALAGLNGWLDRRQAARDYADSIRDLSKGLKDGFGRKDAENIDAVGTAIAQMAQKMKEGPRQAFLKDEIANLRELANNSSPKARAEILALIKQLSKLVAPKPVKVEVDDGQALAAITRIRSGLKGIPDETVNVRINRLGNSGIGPDRINEADGGFISGPGGPREDRIPAWLSNGEFVVNAAATKKHLGLLHGINAQGFAKGGLTSQSFDLSGDTMATLLGLSQPVNERSEIHVIRDMIRDLQRLLDAEGKNELSKQRKRVVELELKAAEKKLKLAEQEAEVRKNLRGIGQNFSAGLVDAPDLTIAQQAAASVANLRKEILEAGGHWTKGLTRWSKGLIAAASELDDVNAAIVRETARRDALVDALSDQQAVLDQLKSTMEQFASSVASNFLSNPFNQTISGSGVQSQALTDAQAQLAAIRNSPTGDSVAAATLASQLIAQIKQLSQGGGSLTGVQAFEATLDTDLANLTKFEDAIDKLTGSLGLDVGGGLFQGLLANGDVNTAQGLAGMTAEQIDVLEAKFELRAQKTAEFAAKQTQVVFGPQWAAESAAAAALQAAVDQSNAHLANLGAQQQKLEDAIRRMDQGVADKLEPQFTKVTDAQKETTRATKQVGKDAAEHLRWAFN